MLRFVVRVCAEALGSRLPADHPGARRQSVICGKTFQTYDTDEHSQDVGKSVVSGGRGRDPHDAVRAALRKSGV